jgi:large subunit ribosomal protein L9
VVKVTDGYARNYLFPRKLALAVTTENKRQIDRERARAEAHEAEERQEAEAIRTRVEALDVAIARRVGEQETLYGSVTSSDLAEALSERGLPIDRRRIQLTDPLKTLGDHEVAVKLHREVTARLRVKIVPAAD